MTLQFNDNISNTTGVPAQIAWTFRLIVANVAASNDGDVKPNSAQVEYVNDADEPQVQVTVPVSVTLSEPLLIVEKSVHPRNTLPGNTAFYTIRLYHATTSTIPAYNVALEDILPDGLNYGTNSWQQFAGPPAALIDDSDAPTLTAFFAEVAPGVQATNPIELRYTAFVPPDAPLGSLFTNTVTSVWTSLPDDPYGDTRDGSGGINDYRTSDTARLALSEVFVQKTGPLTVVAGSLITWNLSVANLGPYPVISAIVTDVVPFQVEPLEATYQVGADSGVCTLNDIAGRDVYQCAIATIPDGMTARIVISGLVAPDTPEGADLTNVANFTTESPDGDKRNNEAIVETEVYVEADLGITKTGPITATAGELITYTLVLSNSGPSYPRSVDVKDELPPGVDWVSGSTSQGACVNGICQLGDMSVGQVVTMVITGAVQSDVQGVITNSAQTFAVSPDPNPDNDTDNASTTVVAGTALQVDKVDLTDPVYAGDTYFYEIVITNTGPSLAQNVVLVDDLPNEVSYEGTSPECTEAGGSVTCNLGSMAPGEVRDFLVNVRVDENVISGTLGTNVVTVTTTTNIDASASRLTDSEQTTYLQRVGGPLDLQLSKAVNPPSVVANGQRLTYTLLVTNTGPAQASAVQVVDAFPREFEFVTGETSKDETTALCSNGVVCDLGVMEVGETVAITLVFDVPSDTLSGIYTNTAHVSSPAIETIYANNTASVPVQVDDVANLQMRKEATPDPATPGGDLTYHIAITNTGPSDAQNVTVSDTLPAGFVLAAVLPSQGGCGTFPCDLGTMPAGGSATIMVIGSVSSTISSAAEIANTAEVTSTTPGIGASASTSPHWHCRRPGGGQDRDGDGGTWRSGDIHSVSAQSGPRYSHGYQRR